MLLINYVIINYVITINYLKLCKLSFSFKIDPRLSENPFVIPTHRDYYKCFIRKTASTFIIIFFCDSNFISAKLFKMITESKNKLHIILNFFNFNFIYFSEFYSVIIFIVVYFIKLKKLLTLGRKIWFS